MFAVVVFCGKSESVETVPLSWITPSKTHCHWPNTKNSVTISKAVKTMLEKANEKAAIAEETSDMASEISDAEVGKSGKRKRAAINYFPDQFDFVYHDLQPITKVKATEPILLQPPSIPSFLSSSLHISTPTSSQGINNNQRCRYY